MSRRVVGGKEARWRGTADGCGGGICGGMICGRSGGMGVRAGEVLVRFFFNALRKGRGGGLVVEYDPICLFEEFVSDV